VITYEDDGTDYYYQDWTIIRYLYLSMQFVIIKILLQKIRVTKYIYLFNPIAYFVVCNVYCEYLLKTK